MGLVSRCLAVLCATTPWIWLAALPPLIMEFAPLGSYPDPWPEEAWIASLYLTFPAAFVSPLLLSAASALRQLMRLSALPPGLILFNLVGFVATVWVWFGTSGLAVWQHNS